MCYFPPRQSLYTLYSRSQKMKGPKPTAMTLHPWIAAEWNGRIICARCTCMAGLGKAYSTQTRLYVYYVLPDDFLIFSSVHVRGGLIPVVNWSSGAEQGCRAMCTIVWSTRWPWCLSVCYSVWVQSHLVMLWKVCLSLKKTWKSLVLRVWAARQASSLNCDTAEYASRVGCCNEPRKVSLKGLGSHQSFAKEQCPFLVYSTCLMPKQTSQPL